MPRPRARRTALLRPLETHRLQLEPIRANHADAMFDGLHDPSLYAYQTDEPPADRRELRERYARLARGLSPSGHEYWLNWIVVPREAGTAAGYVQATVADDLSSATIGYLVLPAFQRRGVAGEAVDAMVRHLAACGVRVIEAVIDTRNAASIALVERLGFRRRTTRRSDDVIGGARWLDHEYVLKIAEAERPG
ncbi:MAG: [ribosomal protein S5]-alanine N-acetyltransferase [Candidatus Eremiobacteraeota bacterium]|nr:[ribosomal protein S5]-alanine N-acetyltransferase [Candidatus Eremiobacteraeota bacterium]